MRRGRAHRPAPVRLQRRRGRGLQGRRHDRLRRQLGAVYALFAFVTVPFLIFIAPRITESTLHPNCTFLPGSQCEGIVLQEGKIGLLGDRKVELLALEQQGDIVTAQVRVSEPGLVSETLLSPSFDMTAGNAANTPSFPGIRYRLKLETVDIATGSVQLNIAAPGTGTLENARTLFTFLASIAGFTGLFVWLFMLRSSLLGVQWRLAQREGAWR
ncbi:MAG: hypothetical protein HC828_14200 [Blastochloris sp.]|nr:hypothetical protein [Blastochloris sp.]